MFESKTLWKNGYFVKNLKIFVCAIFFTYVTSNNKIMQAICFKIVVFVRFEKKLLLNTYSSTKYWFEVNCVYGTMFSLFITLYVLGIMLPYVFHHDLTHLVPVLLGQHWHLMVYCGILCFNSSHSSSGLCSL